MEEWITSNMGSYGWDLEWYWRLSIVLGIVLAAYLVDLLFVHLVIPSVRKLTAKTTTRLDDILLSDKVCRSFARILPPIVLTTALPFVTQGTLEIIILRATTIYIIVCVTRFLCIMAEALFQAFLYKGADKAHAMRGLVQTLQILISVVGVILAVSVLIDKSPLYLISGLGAMAAVLMLVFQDSIKGLVAGIQLSFNNMLVVGDWIVVQGRNIDGVVIEITLTTIKVRNWDNTILTIPPYNLLTETFQNWRGMQEGDGRRFTRQINVDMHTVCFADKKTGKTNLEAYREALYGYLKNHPAINAEMTLMVRQLPAGSEGIPVQMYAFTRTKEWEEFENLQACFVEYALALLPEFGLRPYQRGSDFRHTLTSDQS